MPPKNTKFCRNEKKCLSKAQPHSKKTTKINKMLKRKNRKKMHSAFGNINISESNS
jgi:hypothetical protein